LTHGWIALFDVRNFAQPRRGPERNVAVKRELVMFGIIQANIDRFNELLKTETDETKRKMITRLLAEEEAKQLPESEKRKIFLG
jgi:hypothetical protein